MTASTADAGNLELVNNIWGGAGDDHVGGDGGTDFIRRGGQGLVWGGRGDDFCSAAVEDNLVHGNIGDDVMGRIRQTARSSARRATISATADRGE